MFFAIVRMLVFAGASVILAWNLFRHGSKTVQYTLEHENFDWPNVGIDLLLLVALICTVTWTKQAWQRRHQGQSHASRQARKRQRKTIDNIRIPK